MVTSVGLVPAPFLTAPKVYGSICAVIRVWFASGDRCRFPSGTSSSSPYGLGFPLCSGQGMVHQ